MALIKISDTMADAVMDAGQSSCWTEHMERNGITDRLIVVCSPQTTKALITRGLVEHIEGSVQEGRFKGVKNIFTVLTPAGELLRKYLKAGGEQRSFGENQLTDGRLPLDRAGDAVRAQQAAEEPEPCGRIQRLSTGDTATCQLDSGHSMSLHDRDEPESTVCGAHPSYSTRRSLGLPDDTEMACLRSPEHAGGHRNTPGHTRSSVYWGVNESSDKCGAPIAQGDTGVILCDLKPGHDGVHSSRPVPSRTGGKDMIVTHESATPDPRAVITVCGRRTGETNAQRCTRSPRHAGLCSHLAQSARTPDMCGDAEDSDGFLCTLDPGHAGDHAAVSPARSGNQLLVEYVFSTWPRETSYAACQGEPLPTRTPEQSTDHVSHTVKIWYVSGAYEEVGPLPQRHAATIYAECEGNELVAAAEIHGHVQELIQSHLRG